MSKPDTTLIIDSKKETQKIIDHIKKIRVEKKINQEKIAVALGISQNAYSKIERGETKLSVAYLITILHAMDATLSVHITKEA
ncbi:MAG: helix-turn-helix transcriptional regulator [Mucilaginibacter sp.]|nr:helix-turn-helix transcriptional regulator [Mucilaginibacter sp.]